jgi:hypothetical protein
MSIYTDNNNELVKDIMEWCKNNPIDLTQFKNQNVPAPCSFAGMKHTEETKKQISESHKGKDKPWLQTEETKKKRRVSSIGKKMPERDDVWKEKQRLSQIGKKRKPFTEEHRRKLSEASKNRQRKPLTEEHKENIRKGITKWHNT